MTPDKYTIKEIFLDVSDGHQIYIQDWGSPKAITPIIFFHGGPGGGIKDKHKGIFNPERQRVIFFDQRGCGKSLPYGSINNNTTAELIEDIEQIANHFKLKEFVITGGSWGSCLALAYSIKYPKRVVGLVLHGIFTGSQTEIDWLDKGQFQAFFPDVWEDYLNKVPANRRSDPSLYFYEQVMGKDEAKARDAGYNYEVLEGSLMSLDDRFTPDDISTYDPAGIRIEMHYLHNRCFLADKYILNNAHKLTMPVWLIQGRYDTVCPPITAHELNKKLHRSQLIWTINGHKADHESWNIQRTVLSQWG